MAAAVTATKHSTVVLASRVSWRSEVNIIDRNTATLAFRRFRWDFLLLAINVRNALKGTLGSRTDKRIPNVFA
jgi:hypothetical protein